MQSRDTLNIEVTLLATFKMLAGKNHLVLRMEPGQSILDAFFLVLDEAPALRSHWLDPEGQPRNYVHTFLNGEDAATLPAGLLTKLKDGDCLDFVPPVAGG